MEFISRNIRYVDLIVKGHCEVCKQRIESAALSIKGVISAVWIITEDVLHLSFDPQETDLDEISRAVAMIGYDTERHSANKIVQENLPDCCK